MGNPTFDGISLTAKAPRQRDGSRRFRGAIGHMPGVNGAYVQPMGTGEKLLIVSGLISYTTSASAAAAVTGLRAAIETIQEKQALDDVGEFIEADGTTTRTSCILQSYDQAGPVMVSKQGANYVAYCPIQAVIVDLIP